MNQTKVGEATNACKQGSSTAQSRASVFAVSRGLLCSESKLCRRSYQCLRARLQHCAIACECVCSEQRIATHPIHFNQKHVPVPAGNSYTQTHVHTQCTRVPCAAPRRSLRDCLSLVQSHGNESVLAALLLSSSALLLVASAQRACRQVEMRTVQCARAHVCLQASHVVLCVLRQLMAWCSDVCSLAHLIIGVGRLGR